MSSRSSGSKSRDTTSKRVHEYEEDDTGIKKWCKATWYRKGKCGKTESDVIPRSWVSKSRNIVSWPPKDMNFKTAIEQCSKPIKSSDCTTLVLVRCTESVNSLEEARQLQTEEPGSSGSEGTDDDLSSKKTEVGSEFGRGQRSKQKSSTLQVYETGSHLDDTTERCGDESSENGSRQQAEETVCRVLETGLGDTSTSASELQAVAYQLDSPSCSTPSFQVHRSAITIGMKKSMGSKIFSKSVPEDQSADTDFDNFTNPEKSPESDHVSHVQALNKSASSAAEMSSARMENLLLKFVAESKVRHEEMMEKINNIDIKVNTVIKGLSKIRISGTQAGSDGTSTSLGDMTVVSSDGEQDNFCVDLPVHTVDDFWMLEEELVASSAKRTVLVSNYSAFHSSVSYCIYFPIMHFH
jgi:hypothetical protein